jgi:hypothetical protein
VESLPEGFAALIDGIRMALEFARGNTAQAESILSERVALVEANRLSAATVAVEAAQIGDYDTAGELLLQAYREKDGTWIFPGWIRGPEQAPDSKPWQEFWQQPGVKELAELRSRNGLDPQAPTFGSGAKP